LTADPANSPPATRHLLFGLPLFHVGGALTQALAALSSGSTLVVLGPAGWREPHAVRNVWRLVERYRPAVLAGVPTVLAAAISVSVNGADIASLRCAAAGGSAVPVPVGRAYEQVLGLPMIEVYGMTSASDSNGSSSDIQVRMWRCRKVAGW
jgi:fatty-acyl-CoA synthase